MNFYKIRNNFKILRKEEKKIQGTKKQKKLEPRTIFFPFLKLSQNFRTI